MRRPDSRWWGLGAVSLGQFMVVMDITVLDIALPAMTRALHASMASLEWAQLGYQVTLIGLVPVFGRLSDMFGRRRLYVAGLLLFASASGAAAACSTVPTLVSARVVQGAGGALVTSNTLAILSDLFPSDKRGLAMGLQSIMVSGGAAVGPVLGGWLVTAFGWPAVFLLNVPLGLATVVYSWFVLPELRPSGAREAIDWIGAGLLLAGLFPLLVAITQAPSWTWADPRTIALGGAGVVLLAGFVVWERHSDAPLIHPELMRIRSLSAGLGAGLLATISLSAMTFLLPFYFQSLRGMSAQRTGLVILPIPLGLMAIAPIAGKLSDVWGSRWLTSAGLTAVAAADILISQLAADASIGSIVWRLLLFGVGLGLFFAPNNNAVMGAPPEKQRGVTSGLLALTRYAGQAGGIAFAGTVFLHAAGPNADALIQGLPGQVPTTVVAQHFMHGMMVAGLASLPLAVVATGLCLVSD